MHELGIAQEIVDRSPSGPQGARVLAWSWRSASSRRSCRTRSGSASTSAAEGTPVAGASLVIIETPGRARCRDCGGDVAARPPLRPLRVRQHRPRVALGRRTQNQGIRGGLMCETCGCSDHSRPRLTDLETGPTIALDDDHDHHHGHHHHAPRSRSRPSPSPPRSWRHARGTTISLETAVLARNDRLAERNRGWLAERGDPGAEPGQLAGSGQDDPARADDPRPGGRAADLGHRRGPGDPERCRADPGDRLPRRPDQHRHGLPPRRVDDRPRPGAARPAPALGRPDRERRQPRLPGPLRPRRARQGRHRLGHRGRRQAAQVSAHVPSQCSS